MSSRADAVLQRLESTWTRWWLFSLLTGLALGACASLATLGAFVLTDAALRLPQGVLGVLFVAWAVLTLGLVVTLGVRLVRFRRGLEATARRVELEFPELGSHLINLVQFSEQNGHGPDPWREAAREQSAAAVADVPFEKAADREGRWRRFVLCMQTPRDLLEASALLVLIVAVAITMHALFPACSWAAKRVLNPWRFVPAVGSVEIVKVTPGDAEVLVGSALEIAAEIENPDGKGHRATLYLRRDGEPETAQTLLPDEARRRYVAALPQVLGPLQYRIEVDDSQTERYTVKVVPKPTVAGVEITYDFPDYMGREPETTTQPHGDLRAPTLTRTTLRVRPSTPIVEGHLLIDGQKVYGTTEDDGRTLRVQLLLTESTSYTIHLFTKGDHTDPEPRVNRIDVVPDSPPSVALVEPAREASAAAGASVPIVVRASDDFGLGSVRIEIQPGGSDGAGGGEPVETLTSWERFEGGDGESVLHHPLTLDPARYQPGQKVQVRAVARDRRALELAGRRLEPQESATAWVPVRVLDRQAEAAAAVAGLDSLRSELLRILREQVAARVAAAEVPGRTAEGEARRLAGAVRTRQVDVQKAAVAVVEAVGETDDDDRLVLKRAVNNLAFGDMLQAVREAETLEAVETRDGRAEPVAALLATQDRIIDALRRLLDAARRDAAEALAELEKRPSTEIPPDIESKLTELRDKLHDFLDQQRKVIEASENLAKKAVEDFTEKDLKELEALAATEDEWSRFMADAHSDLSKLPEQDFANPSLLQELIAVETEIKMAADALTKKTVDIAVPLEQLGAEMAEEMTTNIEKWLPDTPDRERWSQEEPLTDEMKEAPMAELPGELEDLVGDLMEEEEDLFDEMEDMSSSWADSLDKGAGWDAMDGPISNMSARGVTGNRLPNTNEIGGRSGEGRSGKASGEFVGDTAVGKGGRKTPTRLAPDPFVAGEIKDTSKDPVGGATGGGKSSGVGGEGLQGPVPDRPIDAMQRLARRQAELRNKAEAVDLKFGVLNYHQADLKALVEQMASVENDLRNGLYRNALRRREVLLEGLGRVQSTLQGELVVRRDQTANLPAEIQKEILGSMQEPSPAGWEALNRQYFERLATGGGSTPTTPPTTTEPPSTPSEP